MLKAIVVAILPSATPNTTLALPPFTQRFMVAGFGKIYPILEQVKVNGKA